MFVHLRHVNQFLKGNKKADVAMLAALARKLGMSAKVFFKTQPEDMDLPQKMKQE